AEPIALAIRSANGELRSMAAGARAIAALGASTPVALFAQSADNSANPAGTLTNLFVDPAWSQFFIGLLHALAAGVLLLLLVWTLRRLRLWAIGRLEKVALLAGAARPGFAANLGAHVVQAARGVTRAISSVLALVLGYIWLVYSLGQFSYSAAWGQQLGTFLIDLLLDFAKGALGALPGLVAVVIIIFIARWSVRLINATFKEIDAGRILLPGVERETARTTQTLLIAVVWLFALVVAYPYIPGSDTEAFKGLSVLVGLMITLGSTGLINQVISGLFVIYSRSVRPGDYVRIGD